MALPIDTLRQSSAQLLASVVVDLFPTAMVVEASASEWGFFCDVATKQPIDSQALPFLEENMRRVAKSDVEAVKLEMMRENAALFLEHQGQPMAAARVLEVPENIVAIFKLGAFCDYCPHPFTPSMRELLAFKLLAIEPVKRLFLDEKISVIRISGVVQRDQQSLKKEVKALQAGKKRDHRQIGSALGLFAFNESRFGKEPVWLSKGVAIRSRLIEWWQQQYRQQGFEVVSTPMVEEERGAKELSHLSLYQWDREKKKTLPLRYAESFPTQMVSAEGGWGLLNSTTVTKEEARIFCWPEKIEEELISSLQFIDKIGKMFSLGSHWRLKGGPSEGGARPFFWRKVFDDFQAALQKCNIPFECSDEEEKLTGPTLLVHFTDSCGREWKGSTVIADLSYRKKISCCEDTDNSKECVMLVQSLFGSFERMIALILEHHGSLPEWLVSEK